jgi:hypothetical protein
VNDHVAAFVRSDRQDAAGARRREQCLVRRGPDATCDRPLDGDQHRYYCAAVVIDSYERAPDDPPIYFRMLGPLTVEAAGIEQVIGGPRERTALAMLLLERNQIVARDRLIEAVWADDPPSAGPDVHLAAAS